MKENQEEPKGLYFTSKYNCGCIPDNIVILSYCPIEAIKQMLAQNMTIDDITIECFQCKKRHKVEVLK